jgi:hypothetical protein
MAERTFSSSSGGGSGQGQMPASGSASSAQEAGATGPRSSSPAASSSLPGGVAGMGSLGRSVRGRPDESWGAMPPNEREKVLSAIQEKFPGRYRELIEQYYKGLQEVEE